jgi:hypothetical protein
MAAVPSGETRGKTMRGLWMKIRTTRRLNAMFFAAAGIMVAEATPAEEQCERETMISQLISPDDAWVAVVEEHVCSGEGLATTGVDDTVQLLRSGEKPKRGDYVFSISEQGNPLNRPLTRWLSPQKLQITIPNKSLFVLKRDRYEGIEIVVKYEPNDPAERERWLRSRGLAPQ